MRFLNGGRARFQVKERTCDFRKIAYIIYFSEIEF